MFSDDDVNNDGSIGSVSALDTSYDLFGKSLNLAEMASLGNTSTSVMKKRLLRMTPVAAISLRLRAPANRLDLSGQRFGRLIVVERGPSIRLSNKGSTWYCRCDCGRGDLFLARTNLLRNGHQKSCGCLLSCPNDAVGDRFGKLVLERIEGSFYLLKCDCGRSTRIKGFSIRSGNTRSCGCSRRGRALGPVATYLYRGEQRTCAQLAAEANTSTESMYKRLRCGTSPERAVKELRAVRHTSPRGPRGPHTRYPFRGARVTASEIAVALKISRHVVLKLITRMSPDEIEPHLARTGDLEFRHGQRPNTYDVFGEMLTLREIASLVGVQTTTLKERLHRGIDVTDRKFWTLPAARDQSAREVPRLRVALASRS
jgi:hypothetical protein